MANPRWWSHVGVDSRWWQPALSNGTELAGQLAVNRTSIRIGAATTAIRRLARNPCSNPHTNLNEFVMRRWKNKRQGASALKKERLRRARQITKRLKLKTPRRKPTRKAITLNLTQDDNNAITPSPKQNTNLARRSTADAPHPESTVSVESPFTASMNKFLQAAAVQDTPTRKRALDLVSSHPVFSSSSSKQKLFNGHELSSTKPKHNNKVIDLSEPALRGPVNEDAFRKNWTDGAARVAKHRKVTAIVKSVASAGNEDQQRLALREALGHPDIQDLASSIGINLEEVKVALFMVRNLKNLVTSIYDKCKINNNRMSLDAQAFLRGLAMGVLPTPPPTPPSAPTELDETATRKNGVKQNEISDSKIACALGWSSTGAMSRSFGTARSYRKQFKKGNLSALKIRPKYKRRSKFKRDYIGDLRLWMCSSLYSRDSPIMGDTVIQKDMDGKQVIEPTTMKPKRIPKKLICTGPRQLHTLMKQPISEGGFSSEKYGRLFVSLPTMRKYWPNWLVPMSTRYKALCGCECCTLSQDMMDDVVSFRRRFLRELKHEAGRIRNSRQNSTRKEEIKTYERQIFNENGKPIHSRMWQACDSLACPPIKIPGTTLELPHFKCVLGECALCGKFNAPLMELNSDRLISYSLFSDHVRCSLHGPDHIKAYDHSPKVRCQVCEDMKETQPEKFEKYKKSQKPPRVHKKRLRCRRTVPLKSFMARGGPFETQMKKMLKHKNHVKLLSKMHTVSTRETEADETPGTVSFLRDHAEKFQPPAPDGQIQSEYYGQDVSLLLEGSVVKFKPSVANSEGADAATKRTEWYSHVSDDKAQDGNTVYHNIKWTLTNLLRRGMIQRRTFKLVMDLVDGCATQYRCGTVLYFLIKLANEFQIIYDRAVNPPGQGKCVVDGKNGQDKKLLATAVETQTAMRKCEASDEMEVPKMELWQVDENGNRVSFASWAHKQLSNELRHTGIYGAKEKNKKNSSRYLEKSTYHLRKEGDAIFDEILKSSWI